MTTAQTNIFAALTETNAAAVAISAEIDAKAAAKKATKPAAKKATKKAAKEVAQTAPAAQVEEIQTEAVEVDPIEAARVAFVNACIARKTASDEINDAKGVGRCKTIIADAAWFGMGDANNANHARAVLREMAKLGFDLQALAAHFANTESGKGKPYIAIKAITKARQMFTALACNDITKFDGYTYAVLVNMVQTGKALDSHDMMACVSKSVKKHAALSKGVPVECIKDSSPSTASTQVSSTRGFLGDLGILTVTKGKNGDRAEWAQTEQAGIVRDWFVKHCGE